MGVGTGIDGDGDGVAAGVPEGRDGTAWVGRGVGLLSATPLGDAKAVGSVQAASTTSAAARSVSAIRGRNGGLMRLPR